MTLKWLYEQMKKIQHCSLLYANVHVVIERQFINELTLKHRNKFKYSDYDQIWFSFRESSLKEYCKLRKIDIDDCDATSLEYMAKSAPLLKVKNIVAYDVEELIIEVFPDEQIKQCLLNYDWGKE